MYVSNTKSQAAGSVFRGSTSPSLTNEEFIQYYWVDCWMGHVVVIKNNQQYLYRAPKHCHQLISFLVILYYFPCLDFSAWYCWL